MAYFDCHIFRKNMRDSAKRTGLMFNDVVSSMDLRLHGQGALGKTTTLCIRIADLTATASQLQDDIPKEKVEHARNCERCQRIVKFCHLLFADSSEDVFLNHKISKLRNMTLEEVEVLVDKRNATTRNGPCLRTEEVVDFDLVHGKRKSHAAKCTRCNFLLHKINVMRAPMPIFTPRFEPYIFKKFIDWLAGQSKSSPKEIISNLNDKTEPLISEKCLRFNELLDEISDEKRVHVRGCWKCQMIVKYAQLLCFPSATLYILSILAREKKTSLAKLKKILYSGSTDECYKISDSLSDNPDPSKKFHKHNCEFCSMFIDELLPKVEIEL